MNHQKHKLSNRVKLEQKRILAYGIKYAQAIWKECKKESLRRLDKPGSGINLNFKSNDTYTDIIERIQKRLNNK